jgi:hypothetical protein
MAQVTIGGKDYALPRLTLHYLALTGDVSTELAKANEEQRMGDTFRLTAKMMSAWLVEENPLLTEDYIMRHMDYPELDKLQTAIVDAQREAGVPVGERKGGPGTTTRPRSPSK